MYKPLTRKGFLELYYPSVKANSPEYDQLCETYLQVKKIPGFKPLYEISYMAIRALAQTNVEYTIKEKKGVYTLVLMKRRKVYNTVATLSLINKKLKLQITFQSPDQSWARHLDLEGEDAGDVLHDAINKLFAHEELSLLGSIRAVETLDKLIHVSDVIRKNQQEKDNEYKQRKMGKSMDSSKRNKIVRKRRR